MADAPKPDDGINHVPLWKSISADLEKRMISGEFADGFPGEMVLAEHYRASRGTVRNALRPLRESGAVTADRGRRQHVIDAARGLDFGPLHSLFASVRAAGLSQRSVVRTQEVTTNPTVAAILRLSPDEPLFHLERVRLADGEPLARDDVWLPRRHVAGLEQADFTETALYQVLRDRCGITLDGGSEELRADIATELDARLLACPVGDPMFRIERVGMHEGVPIEFRRSHILGRRYTVTTQFGVSRSARPALPHPIAGPAPDNGAERGYA